MPKNDKAYPNRMKGRKNMEAKTGTIVATQMIVNRWRKMRKDIPLICEINDEKDPYAIAIAAAATILRAEVLQAKKVGTEFDVVAFAKEVKKEADGIQTLSPDEIAKLVKEVEEKMEEEDDDE